MSYPKDPLTKLREALEEIKKDVLPFLGNYREKEQVEQCLQALLELLRKKN